MLEMIRLTSPWLVPHTGTVRTSYLWVVRPRVHESSAHIRAGATPHFIVLTSSEFTEEVPL